MGSEKVLSWASGGAGWVTIDRPAELNALDLETIREIEAAVLLHDKDESVRAIIITGAGERSFVSGADIASMRSMTPSQAEEFACQGHACMAAIESCRKPVIAAVNGYALGGGTELVLACDIAIASKNAKFGLPEVKLGIYPGFGGTQRLPRIVGAMMARELIFTGRAIDAVEAFRIGLVNRVVSPSKLKDEVMSVVSEIAANGPAAVATAKWLINDGMSLTLKEGLLNEKSNFIEIFQTKDREEGLSAFLEKRKPCFTGN